MLILQFWRRCGPLADESVWARAPERLALAAVYHEVAEIIGWDAAVDFGMKVWETKRPPSRAKYHPVHGGGYGVIYIPHALTAIAGGELIRLAGRQNAKRLVHQFPGLNLSFPCIVAASMARRNKAISQQIADGCSMASVAFGFDLTERQVRRIIKKDSAQHVK